MASLASERRFDQIDYDNLSEFLSDMARRDRREVLSRLATLLMHLLKWKHQPDHQSSSWRRTIEEQRLELQDLFESGTLRNYGEEVLAKAYERAVKLAAIETGLSESTFPQVCPFTLQEALQKDYVEEEA